MASRNIDVDFCAIAKAYFREVLQRSGQQSIYQSQMAAPVLNHLKLTATLLDWDNRSNVMAAKAFTNLSRDVVYPRNPGQYASGHVKAVAFSEKGTEVTITKGRVAALGRSLPVGLSLPSKDGSEMEIKIDLNDPEGIRFRKETVNANRPFPNIPNGAVARVVSKEDVYEGRFTYAIFPKGSIMLQLPGNDIRGTQGDIQRMIRTLKESSSEWHRALVKNFYLEGNDQTDSQIVSQSRFYWRLEGTFKTNSGTQLSVQ